MKHIGNVVDVDGRKIEPVHCITFGSPCQNLSVAGNRKGLAGEESGLFTEAVRIIKEMLEETNGEYPRYAIWENVPGAFSSNGGEDFRTVLEELCRIKDPDAHVPRPSFNKGKWYKAGVICGDGFSLSLGDRWIWSTSEYHKDARESCLSWILEDTVPQKYYLSAKACKGILNRASKRGKVLPDLLMTALWDMILK